MKIAIQGHPTKGKEVIQILERFGGNNYNYLNATSPRLYYYNGNFNHIDYIHRDSINRNIYKCYTLEEFEKEFPFKIGDKVTIVGLPDFPKIITKITWDCDAILYSFEDSNDTWFYADALKKFEMKEERNIILTLGKAKEWYKKGGELKEVALQAFSEKELTKNELPKTWEEFCTNYPIQTGESYINPGCSISTISKRIEGRDIEMDRNFCSSKKSAKAHLAMIQLEQLRDCWRDGWEPIWNISKKWCIRLWGNELSVGIATNISRFLTFPTKEMAEDFLKCFRDLIEKAGDLI